MSALSNVWVRLRQLVAPPAGNDAEGLLDAEMRYHVDCETKDRIARGMSPAEARRTALRDFGGVDRYKEEVRDLSAARWIDEMADDTRFTLRVLRRNPGYTAAAAITFALGIGLTTAVFSVVYGVVLRPLPYADPERLVAVWETHRARGRDANVVSVPNFESWRAANRSFDDLAAIVPAPATLGGEMPERVQGAEVTARFFAVLGARPVLGRGFSDADATEGRSNIVLLSDGLWRRRFGGSDSIVGRTISLDGRPFTVIGVMPRDFVPPKIGWLSDQDLWLPFVPNEQNRGWGRFLVVIGRLKDDASIATAQRDMASVAERIVSDEGRNTGWSARVVSLAGEMTGEVRRPLLIMLGAVGLLLLLAITNVGSLTVDHIRRRHPELALRRALGASAGRVVRQVMTHCLVLGVIGAVIGIGTAVIGTAALVAMLPPEMPRGGAVRVDGTVLATSVSVALFAILMLGVIAARRGIVGERDGTLAIREAAGRTTGRAGAGGLVIGEVAIGVVLASIAGLMVQSFINLRDVNLGFDPSGVITARIQLPAESYESPASQRAFFDRLGRQVGALPGVEAVSFATTRPFACCAPATSVTLQPLKSDSATADVRYVDSAFFAALRVPSRAGRIFASAESPDGDVNAVVDETLARKLTAGRLSIGNRVTIGLSGGIDATVIGIVGDVHQADVRSVPRGAVYLSAARFPSTVRDIIVRGRGRPEDLVPGMRRELESLDPAVALAQVTTLHDAVGASIARDRFTATILGLFAMVAIILAMVGIYGVFAADVSARRKEIGLRMALGASPGAILGLLVARGATLAVAGAVIGVIAGVLLSRSMSALVFGLQTSDPGSFASVAALLVGVAMAATLVPAIRAAKVDPMEALRSGA